MNSFHSQSLLRIRKLSTISNRVATRPFFSAEKTEMKEYQENKLIKLPAQVLYEVISDVGKYNEFVPWCLGSKVLSKDPMNTNMRAELVVGFQAVKESYISNVTMYPPKRVVAVSSQTSLFSHLRSEWKVVPANDPSASWVTFRVEFQFKQSIYNQLSDLFMKEVAKKMVQAFENRCRVVSRQKARDAVAAMQNGQKA